MQGRGVAVTGIFDARRDWPPQIAYGARSPGLILSPNADGVRCVAERLHRR